MMKASRFAAIAAGVAAIGLAGSALAQNVAAGPEVSGHITDTRTGKVWSPNWDSLDAVQPTDPNNPVNREFNPRDQRASIPGMVELHPKAELMGTVPMTAGPTVPVMTIDSPSLQAVPGKRWIAVLYVTNNSAGSINPIVDCHFTNHGQKVESVRVIVPTAGPGERLGMAVRGPRIDMFTDTVTCVPMSPK
jgi:hypothetical protein